MAGEWTVQRHLEGKPTASVDLFHRFLAMVEGIGPFEFSVSKTTVTLKGPRRGFAGVRPDASGIRGYFDVQRMIEDERITNVTPYTARLFVHQYRVTDAAQLDEEFAGWLREAYAVGQGAHLRADPS